MTKKASELKRGDITPMGAVAHKFYHGDGLAVLCDGGQWFDCHSGDDVVKLKGGNVKARHLTTGLSIKISGRLSPVRVYQIAGDETTGFLIAGFRREGKADIADSI